MTLKAKRKWVRDTIAKWRARMFLGEWYLTIAHAKVDDPNGAAATCCADPVYMNATITIYPLFWTMSLDERVHCLIHEMAHCHTQSIWNVANSLYSGQLVTPDAIHAEIERLTQRMANICYQQEWG